MRRLDNWIRLCAWLGLDLGIHSILPSDCAWYGSILLSDEANLVRPCLGHFISFVCWDRAKTSRRGGQDAQRRQRHKHKRGETRRYGTAPAPAPGVRHARTPFECPLPRACLPLTRTGPDLFLSLLAIRPRLLVLAGRPGPLLLLFPFFFSLLLWAVVLYILRASPSPLCNPYHLLRLFFFFFFFLPWSKKEREELTAVRQSSMCPGSVEAAGAAGKSVCVMDAAGPLGHALVDRLLRRGYTVHAATYAACGDGGDDEEEEEATTAALLSHLSSSCGGDAYRQRLKLFRADPFDYHAIADAVRGCAGVFCMFNTPDDQAQCDVSIHIQILLFFFALFVSVIIIIIIINLGYWAIQSNKWKLFCPSYGIELDWMILSYSILEQARGSLYEHCSTNRDSRTTMLYYLFPFPSRVVHLLLLLLLPGLGCLVRSRGELGPGPPPPIH